MEATEKNEIRIDELLTATKVPGINNLIAEMHRSGYYSAPCSGSFHLAKEGGLAEHSLNVFNTLVALDQATGADLDYTDMVVVALLHDLGKMGDYGKPNYVENILKSGKRSDSKPYETNKDLLYVEHEIRSLQIAERYILLTEEQAFAILHHNGLYGKLDSSFGSYYDKTKLAFLLHVADMYCSRFVEVE